VGNSGRFALLLPLAPASDFGIMNEQLIVKNFGPVVNSTIIVEFKKVTVLIGPTGGGKSTLAKLAAIFRNTSFYSTADAESARAFFKEYSLENYFEEETALAWTYKGNTTQLSKKGLTINQSLKEKIDDVSEKADEATFRRFISYISKIKEEKGINVSENKEEREAFLAAEFSNFFRKNILHDLYKKEISPNKPNYTPSERAFVPAIEYSWAGLMRDDIGLPKQLLDFANTFSTSKRTVKELEIPFLNAKYFHSNGQDFIHLLNHNKTFRLYETASGFQSITPLMVTIEALSRQLDQSQSFIIEEPELNLYPTAQQELLNWLIARCSTGENDLTITTHSPYILSHLNLLLYAYQVATKHPDRKEAVAAIVPESSWINPKEFACYQVENGGVKSLVNDELGLIDNNELDALSGDAADAFDNLIRLSKGVAVR
jgi:predicted ATPase